MAVTTIPMTRRPVPIKRSPNAAKNTRQFSLTFGCFHQLKNIDYFQAEVLVSLYHSTDGSNFSPLMMWLWAVQIESASLLDLPKLKGTWREFRLPSPASIIDDGVLAVAATSSCKLFLKWDPWCVSSLSASDAKRFSSEPRLLGTMTGSSPVTLLFFDGESTIIVTLFKAWFCSRLELDESESILSSFLGPE